MVLYAGCGPIWQEAILAEQDERLSLIGHSNTSAAAFETAD